MSLRLKRTLAVALPFAFTAAACSGAGVSDLFAVATGSANIEAGPAPDAQPDLDAQPPEPDQPDTATMDSSVADAARDTGVPDAARDTGTPDAARDTGAPDAARDSSKPIDDTNGVVCGMSYCDSSKAFCCGTRQPNARDYSVYDCLAAGTDCSGTREAAAECDGAEDCGAGEVCCGDFIVQSVQRVSTWDSMKCEPRAACNGTSMIGAGANREQIQRVVMCKPNSGSAECPQNLTCTTSPFMTGYGYCSAP
jgi:hypothetical protein